MSDKKYFTLYRSADGLEKREQTIRSDVHNKGVHKMRLLKGVQKTRLYRHAETVLSHDGENITETYIYDEVI